MRHYNDSTIASQVNLRPNSTISCGKMFMLNDRLSFIGTASMFSGMSEQPSPKKSRNNYSIYSSTIDFKNSDLVSRSSKISLDKSNLNI